MKEWIFNFRTSSGYSDKRTSSKYVVDSNNSSNYIDSGTNYIDDSRNYIDDSRNYIDDPLNYIADKGQLISKCLFGVFNSSKKRTKTIRPEVT